MRSKSAVWLFAMALVACALPGIAMASSSRTQGMGLQSDYILDYTNVPNYPSAIVRYQNLVYGDLGVKAPFDGNDDLSDFSDNNFMPGLFDADRSLGVFLGNLWGGRAGTFGVILNENNAPLSSALGSAYFNRNENEAWNILWGYKFSNFTLGLEFNRSFSSAEDTEFVDKPYTGPSSWFGTSDNARSLFNLMMMGLGADHWNTLGVGGGISIDWESDARPNFADLSVELRQNSFEFTDKLAATTFEDDAGMSYAVNGRAHLSMSDDFHWMPVVNYYHLDMSTQAGGTSFDNTVNGINAGVAAQWRLRESDWFVLGGSFQSVTADFEDLNNRDGDFAGGPGKIEYMTMPNIFASLESNLWSWFTLRLGASKPAFGRLKLTGSASETIGQAGEFELKDSPFQYSVGAGFHLGRVDLDAVMNQDFPFTGTWLASGNSEIPFTRLSATYRW